MKITLSYLGAALSFGFLIASAIINYTFGTRLAETETLKQVMGVVAVLSVGYNAICPFLFQWWRSKAGKALAAVLWALCLVYTATSAVGFAAENRTLVQSTKTASNANLGIYHDMLKDELAKKKKNDRKIEELRLKVISMNEKGAAVSPDPQAKLLAFIIGQEENAARTGLVVLFALLLEIGASVGLFASLGHLTETKPIYDYAGRPLKK